MKSDKKNNIGIVILIMLSCIFVLLIFIVHMQSYLNLSKKHVDYMETNNITSISDSNGGDYVYCISKDGTVYELYDNTLTEKQALFGAKDIIVNKQGTFVLSSDESLYSYDESTNTKQQILNAGECKEMVNCCYYFAAILNSDELLVSWDTADENQKTADCAQMKRIPLETKPEKISAMNMRTSIITKYVRGIDDEASEKYVAIVDENSDLWIYGHNCFGVEEEDWFDIGLRKPQGFGKVSDIAKGSCYGLIYKTTEGALMHYGYDGLGLYFSSEEDIENDFMLTEMDFNGKTDDIVQIKVNNAAVVFVDSNNVVYDTFHDVGFEDAKLYKLAKFKDNIKVYLVDYKVYVILENGDVYLFDNEKREREIMEHWNNRGRRIS